MRYIGFPQDFGTVRSLVTPGRHPLDTMVVVRRAGESPPEAHCVMLHRASYL